MSRQRILLSLAVLGIGILFWLSWPAPTSPRPPLPQPNGYDDFIKAGAKLTDFTGDYRQFELARLQAIVTSNAPALVQLRLGLQRECRVPFYDAKGLDSHLSEISGCKRLATALAVEGRLAQMEGRTNDAARAYLDVIRFGHEVARGGFLIDHYVGLACEAIGAQSLARIVFSLDATECRAVLAAWGSIEAKRESSAEVLRLEEAWSRENGRFLQRLSMMIQDRSLNPSKRALQRYLPRRQAQIAAEDRVRLELSERARE